MRPDSNERLLRAIVRALESIQPAISNQDKQQPPIEIRSELSLPASILEFYAAEQRDRLPHWWHSLKSRLEVIAICAAIAAAVFTGLSLRQIARQSNTMQRQLEATDRPWIQVQLGPATKPEAISIAGASPDNPLTIDQNGQGSLMFSQSFTNIGKSVANRVDASLYRVLATGDRDSIKEPLEEQTRLCGKPNQPIENAALFPTQPFSQNVVGIFQTKGLPDSSSKYKTVHLFIVGCVNYDYPTSATIHQTGFIYEVFPGPTYAEIHQPITVPLGGTPIHQLSFELRVVYAK